jgi:hypothetical protein
MYNRLIRQKNSKKCKSVLFFVPFILLYLNISFQSINLCHNKSSISKLDDEISKQRDKSKHLDEEIRQLKQEKSEKDETIDELQKRVARLNTVFCYFITIV